MIVQADALRIPVADDSVQCVVTSPPYWGLRDYGIEGQLGMESTPEEYVERMVEVFRGVRRVLRNDGTLWLNLGSSYYVGPQDHSHGISDKGSPDYRGGGCPLIHLCDGCRGSIFSCTEHTDVRRALVSDACEGVPILVHTELRVLCLGSSGSVDRIPTQLSNLSTHDRKQIEDLVRELLGVSLESMTLESWQQPPGECWHCDNCGACLSVLASSGRDAQKCARRGLYIGGNFSPRLPLDVHTPDKNPSSSALGHCGITYYKTKDLIGIPWMVALALQKEGWYLRQDIIWAKPNPMPESVTDRCTKSHEYLFLLTKSPRYKYDADAIAEPCTVGDNGSRFDTGKTRVHQGERMQEGQRVPSGWDTGPGGHKEKTGRYKKSGNTKRKNGVDRGCPEGSSSNVASSIPWEGDTRNKRSVWTILPEPFPGAHFATFPQDLVIPCVKAGSQKGDLVMDPFCGSGTTGMVALRLERNFVGLELNREYIGISKERMSGGLLFC